MKRYNPEAAEGYISYISLFEVASVVSRPHSVHERHAREDFVANWAQSTAIVPAITILIGFHC
jgi:Tat protein secretion system quality control protein TatD with DNase activity